MKRKNALRRLAAMFGGLAASSTIFGSAASASGDPTVTSVPNLGKPLHPPAHGPVQVGIVMGPELVSIDIFGPWSAFDNAFINMDMSNPLFNVYAIAATTEPLDVDGLKVQPQYSFKNAPQSHVLIVPQQKDLPATIDYIREASVNTDVAMSVCTGAFLAAKAGLFDGLKATTHHDGYDAFEKTFPKVTLVRGPRYFENRNVSSSGGESSGIDLALRVIERYYGTQVVKDTAYNMEYRRTPRPQSADDV
jgi:transcriptional regulator GlxA family with amidase domain